MISTAVSTFILPKHNQTNYVNRFSMVNRCSNRFSAEWNVCLNKFHSRFNYFSGEPLRNSLSETVQYFVYAFNIVFQQDKNPLPMNFTTGQINFLANHSWTQYSNRFSKLNACFWLYKTNFIFGLIIFFWWAPLSDPVQYFVNAF